MIDWRPGVGHEHLNARLEELEAENERLREAIRRACADIDEGRSGEWVAGRLGEVLDD